LSDSFLTSKIVSGLSNIFSASVANLTISRTVFLC
jgi:hypothetical protein